MNTFLFLILLYFSVSFNQLVTTSLWPLIYFCFNDTFSPPDAPLSLRFLFIHFSLNSIHESPLCIHSLCSLFHTQMVSTSLHWISFLNYHCRPRSWAAESDRNYLGVISSTLATSCEELTHWKRLWCREGLGTRGEGDDRGWDGWTASLTRWTWVSVNSGSWWWTGRPGVLRFMGSQRVGHGWATDLNLNLNTPVCLTAISKSNKQNQIHNHCKIP